MSAKSLPLPWSRVQSEALTYRAILAVCLVLFVVLATVITLQEVEPPAREELEQLPPQLARIIKEQKPKPVTRPKPKEEVKKPKPIEPKKLIPKPKALETVKKAPKERTATKNATKEQIKQAKVVAQQSGIFAQQQQMAALTSQISAANFSSPSTTTTAKTGEAKSDLNLSNTVAKKSSAKANAAQRVASSGATLANANNTTLQETEAEAQLALAEQAIPTRSEEDIQAVVEGLRSTYNLLYNSALRKEPFLAGGLVLRVTIEPSGIVSDVEVLSTELENKAFVRKLVNRMKLTNFGASLGEVFIKDLEFDFSPS